jgi:hypothetical protein
MNTKQIEDGGSESKSVCLWSFDEYHSYYETSCAKTFCFTDGDEKSSEFKFCPYCGLTIEAVNPESEEAMIAARKGGV